MCPRTLGGVRGRCRLGVGEGQRWFPSVSPVPAPHSATGRRRRADGAHLSRGRSPSSENAGGRGVTLGGAAGPQPEPAARPGRGGRGAAAPHCANLRAPAGSAGGGPSHPHRRLPALPPGPAPGPSRCRKEPACRAPGPQPLVPALLPPQSGLPPYQLPSRPRPVLPPLSLIPQLAPAPARHPPAPVLPRRPSRSRLLRLPLGLRLASGAGSPRPPRARCAPAAAWSCQDGDPAARVALGFPPRGLRADETQKPPQRALAEPDPSGRELLQQRQAARLQRQRLAPEERQAGARKGASIPGASVPHLPRARPPTPGRGPSARGGLGRWPDSEAGRPRPPSDPGLLLLHFFAVVTGLWGGRGAS